ncbi:hypothetical protein MYP14_23375 [Rhodococcus pyridinivorans]|nr:hypothetical protein MYP14_23375 [Rhodococcus pyridinivorans]
MPQVPGYENEHATAWILMKEPPYKCSSFDGFAKTYLIGQQVPLDWVARNPTHDCQLVAVEFDRSLQESFDTNRGRSLPRPFAQEAQARLRHYRTLTTEGFKETEGIVDWLVPSDLECLVRQLSALKVWKGDRVDVWDCCTDR